MPTCLAAGNSLREPKSQGNQQSLSAAPAQTCLLTANSGLSTQIHATVDALGNPTGFALSPGQAHDLDGADILLPEVEAGILICRSFYSI